MFKLLFIGGLIYLLYRMSIPSSLQSSKDKDSIVTPKEAKEKKVDEDDYIDYEEVD